MSKTTITDATLASKYSTTSRTVRRWRKAGAPLADPGKMTAWLTNRRYIPEGTQRVLSSARGKRTGKAAKPSTDPGNVGAPGALGRLAEAELAAYRAFMDALQGGDAISVKGTRETWLRVAEQLRSFDSSVEADRRQSGNLIDRSTLADLAEGLGVYLRFGTLQCIQMAGATEALWNAEPCTRLVALQDADRNLRTNVLALVKAGWWKGNRIAPWLVDAVGKGLTADFGGDPAQAARVECFKVLLTITPDQIREVA